MHSCEDYIIVCVLSNGTVKGFKYLGTNLTNQNSIQQ